ncbi:MAG: sulfatase-like hydrolase/transferase [Melioribacteraceae bacterium]|nr:MAG: sulfatase-like hydrolase/transferase [Melioribacteraceae bacterium]
MSNLIKLFSKIDSLIPKHIKFLFGIYFLGILFFTFIRILLLFVNWDYASDIPANEKFEILFTSFIYGFRFDTVISGYILILPFIFLSITSFFKREFIIPYKFVLVFTTILYLVTFFIGSANIPYFNYFFSNITSVVFNWFEDYSFALRMISSDIFMSIFVLIFLLLAGVYIYVSIKFYRRVNNNFSPSTSAFKFYSIRIFSFVFFLLVLILAIRGRVEEKSPIRIGTAYFSEYSFANQLGLNPTYTLLVSLLEDKKLQEEKVSFVNDEIALENTKQFLGVTDSDLPTPISRKITAKNLPTNKNVILVIMESMASVRMNHFGNESNLTPNLDSLINISISFSNFYTSGIHTYNGVYSTLFSFPTIWNRHPMKPSIIPNLNSIVSELKENNYHTYFFVAHDDQFDNMAGFLYGNGFEKVFCERNYPSEWILSTLGVPDHILFEETIKLLNENLDNKPFFASLLTASNHDPKIIPEGIDFIPTAETEDERLVQYCDWSIKYFLDRASEQDWYENTLFIFVADHGRSVKQPYDLPITFFHSPFIIYSPGEQLTPAKYSNFSLQIDVMPTIAGLLYINYTNNTLGIDVINERRPFAFFSGDNAIGVLSENEYLIYKRDGDLSLFNYRVGSTKNIISEYQIKADSMLNYTHSMFQTSQYIIENFSTKN